MKLLDLASDPAEERFERLAKAIDLPDSKYEAAERSYKAVGKWLDRDDSEFKDVSVNVYTQGSFRLGTAIQPLDREDEYDLDIVCEFSLPKLHQTQSELHAKLGRELAAYASRYNMDPPEGWDRCWTLNYAESAKFHMDVLPCLPDAHRQRSLRESLALSLNYVDGSVAITDKKHKNFRVLAEEWPASNPNGFAAWFYERMRPAFEKRREHMRLVEAKADVQEIPEFRVKTPLQLAIQILKRHRDVHFTTLDPELRPSSIVITTLAAHAYAQQSTVLSALLAILDAIPKKVETRGAQYYIPNPADPRENFADAWNQNLEKAKAFFEWARTAQLDFVAARSGQDTTAFIKQLAPSLGGPLMETAFSQVPIKRALAWKIAQILGAKHRRMPEWPVSSAGTVQMTATYKRNGFRTQTLVHNAPDLPIGCTLTFAAQTDVPQPYQVFWQVVNTGVAATDARQLRGEFERPRVSDGHLDRTENTRFPGTHSIECFIVKNGFVAARSGLFIVNIGG